MSDPRIEKEHREAMLEIALMNLYDHFYERDTEGPRPGQGWCLEQVMKACEAIALDPDPNKQERLWRKNGKL